LACADRGSPYYASNSIFQIFSFGRVGFYFHNRGNGTLGRWLVGALELVASILLFIPAMVWLGAILAIGLMAGAIGMHVTLLGIEVQGDGGQLFMYAAIVLVCASYVFWIRRKTIPVSLQKWLPSFLK
jgi:putative oxidoreductase